AVRAPDSPGVGDVWPNECVAAAAAVDADARVRQWAGYGKRVVGEAAQDAQRHGLWGDLPDDVVGAVDNEQVAGGTDRDTRGVVELGSGRRYVVTAVAWTCAKVAGNGGDDPRGADLADNLIRQVRDEQVAGGIDRDSRRVVQRGGDGRAAVAAVTCSTIAGDGGDNAGADLADDIVVVVGDEEIAGSIHRNARGVGELGA